MTGDASLHLRVSRLENETESIYELITEVRSTQQEHTQRLTRVEERLAGVDERLAGVDERLATIESTLHEVVRRLPEPPAGS
ncbi:hypothetical protein [Nocardioides soli]|uniref:Chromosome segregation ATPase n=1 Tax=Nocardioides soli TaxID=1036020 RepID=A0A7W4Z0Q9_9ACTN|nr:hypothetical protein [Nocardioides soli]MBB3040715.1 chromosome segregation ATPase [Nocardioides soli]